jgi:hypothetical protein
MPDEPELQAAFPQPKGQKRGCGFPVARLVALFDWATGALVDLAVDKLKVHEVHLARRLWDQLSPGEVLMGDRAFSSYGDLARLLARGVDSVCRLHQRRKADYRQGQRLGRYDRLICWPRPVKHLRPRGMTVKEWSGLPQTLEVRILRIHVQTPGFRSRTLDIVTTLLDPRFYSAKDIAQLYRDRWMAELNLRSLKTHLGMAVLRSKSTDVVQKEIVMHMLAYNLIRLLMCEAARRHGRSLHRLSFSGTMHRISAVMPLLAAAPEQSEELITSLLQWIASDQLPDRPDRREPRRVKRRANNYSYLTEPRAKYKARKGDIDRDAR